MLKRLIKLSDYLHKNKLFEEYNYIKLVIKKATPLEEVVHSNSLKVAPDDFIIDKSEGNTVYDYKKYFNHVSESVFVFYVTPQDYDSDIAKFIIDKSTNEDGFGVDIEDATYDLKILDDVPEIKNFLIKKCTESNIDYNSIAVMFIRTTKKGDNLSQTPEFSLHDIAHSILKSDDSSLIDDYVIRQVSSFYEDEEGRYMNNLNISAKRDLAIYIIDEEARPPGFLEHDHMVFGVQDWGNHIYSMSLSGIKNYITLPEKITLDIRNDRKTFTLIDQCKDEDCVSHIESLIKIFCQSIMRESEGKVMISFL